MNEPEIFKFTSEVKCVDIDGIPIREGSVLQLVGKEDRGVVTRIVRPGDKTAPFMSGVGDMIIRLDSSSSRVSNRYAAWQHVKVVDWTYEERFISWITVQAVTPFEKDPECDLPYAEQRAMDGITALLPPDTIDYENGDWPRSIEDALRILSDHLMEMSKKINKIQNEK